MSAEVEIKKDNGEHENGEETKHEETVTETVVEETKTIVEGLSSEHKTEDAEVMLEKAEEVSDGKIYGHTNGVSESHSNGVNYESTEHHTNGVEYRSNIAQRPAFTRTIPSTRDSINGSGRILKIVTETMHTSSIGSGMPSYGQGAASTIRDARERDRRDIMDLNDKLASYIEKVIMFRAVVALSLVATAVMAAPINSIDDVPAEYKDLIPAQAKEFLTGLTEDDKKVMKEIASNYASYKSEDEIMAALKEKSPTLHEKAEKLHLLLKEKIDALGDEAKAFAKEVIGEARKIHIAVVAGNKPSLDEIKTKIVSGVEKYKALSEAAKADLEKQFPITASVFKNEKFQEIAKKLLNKN